MNDHPVDMLNNVLKARDIHEAEQRARIAELEEAAQFALTALYNAEYDRGTSVGSRLGVAEDRLRAALAVQQKGEG